MLIWERALILKSSTCQHSAATQFPMLCVHDAKPVTGFDFHTLKYSLGPNYTTSQSVGCGCSYLFKKRALFPFSDHRGGSPGCALISFFI